MHKLAYETGHKDACFYFYLEDPTLDFFLKAAADQGHPEVIKILKRVIK